MVPKVYITCYSEMARDRNNQLVGAPLTPPLAEQIINITHESIAGDPFPPYTRFISVKSEAQAALAFGNDPIADPKFHVIDEGEYRFYGVLEGHKIAVIDSTVGELNDSDDAGQIQEEITG